MARAPSPGRGANGAKAPALSIPLPRAGLDWIEAKLDALTRLLTYGRANGHTRLLRGHAAIGAYVGLSAATVRRYAKKMGFPALRWGRHVVSSPALIDAWLLAVDRKKREARRLEDR